MSRVTQAQVNASLVAADRSAQPGRPLTVALKLRHQRPWHTYWLNPGIGEATSVEWKLPEGWQASEINWPTPNPIHGTDGYITGHGYEGVIYLPVTITPPKVVAGESVTLAAAVRWLMCTEEICIPDKASLQLRLPVSADPPAPNAEVRAELANMPFPRPPPKEWKLQAARGADAVTLRIEGAGELKSPHFFSTTELIAYDGAQRFEQAGSKHTLTLPIDKSFEEELKELIGVLAFTDAAGAYTGIQIAVPFAHADAPAAGTKVSDLGSSRPESDAGGSSVTSPSQTGLSQAAPKQASSSVARSELSDVTIAGSAPSVAESDMIASSNVIPSASDLAAADPAISTNRAVPAFASVGAMSLLQALGFAMLGGLILNLMPCVLPILALKALSLTHVGGSGPGAERQGMLYTAGVLASFAVVAAVLIALKAAAGGIGWGFHLQNPFVVLALALVMAAVGFNLLGVFEFGARWAGSGQALTQGESGRASFFTGVLAVVVATPCTAPFMATALGYALVQPALVSLAVFLALGLGFAAPFLVVSLWPVARRMLPRPGPWMVTFRQALAFPMFLTAVWLLWVLGGQRGVDGMAVGAVAITLLGVSMWALSCGASDVGAPWRWRLTAATSAMLMIGSVAFGLADEGPRRNANMTVKVGPARKVAEVVYSPEALQRLLAEGRPVFAYFTADWCVTCKVNERVAIHREGTVRLFAERGIVVMVGDWTNADPAITGMLTAYGRAGVPMYLYFPAGTSTGQGRLLPQVLTPAVIRSEIDSA